MIEGTKKTTKARKFRQLTQTEKQKLIKSAKEKSPQGYIVVVECHPKCKIYGQLQDFRYIVHPTDKVKEIDDKIKKKIIENSPNFSKQSLFLFSKNTVLNRQVSFEEIYNKNRSKDDDILYLFFANVDAF